MRIARTLIEEKTQLRVAELGYAESHLARLRDRRPESIETSSLHLDVLRDLKRIHSHICSVAYPALEAAGELQPNRLKERSDRLPSCFLYRGVRPEPVALAPTLEQFRHSKIRSLAVSRAPARR